MAYKTAHFKTAKDQYEIVLDTKVSEDLEVGAICTYTSGTNTLAGASAAAAGSYIVAQSDQSMEYGHIPVENRDYGYSSKVKASTTPKKVAVFRISDVTDVIVNA